MKRFPLHIYVITPKRFLKSSAKSEGSMLKFHSQDYTLIGISLYILQKMVYILVLIFLSRIFICKSLYIGNSTLLWCLENTLVFWRQYWNVKTSFKYFVGSHADGKLIKERESVYKPLIFYYISLNWIFWGSLSNNHTWT